MSSPYNKMKSSSLARSEEVTTKNKDNTSCVTESYARINDRYNNNDNDKTIMANNDNRLSSSPFSTSTVGNSSNNSSIHTRTASYAEQPIIYNNINNKNINIISDKNQYDISSNDSFCRGSVNFTGKSLNTMTSALNDVTYYSYFNDFHYNLCNKFSNTSNR